MTNDELIKHVFDNLRNFFLSVSLVTAGGAVIKFHKSLSLEPWLAFSILVVFVIVSAFLIVWNGAHGVVKLVKHKHKLFIVVLFIPYLALAMVAWRAVPLLNLHANTEAAAPTATGAK